CHSVLLCLAFYSSGVLRDLHSFPTRRSSDLAGGVGVATEDLAGSAWVSRWSNRLRSASTSFFSASTSARFGGGAASSSSSSVVSADAINSAATSSSASLGSSAVAAENSVPQNPDAASVNSSST